MVMAETMTMTMRTTTTMMKPQSDRGCGGSEWRAAATAVAVTNTTMNTTMSRPTRLRGGVYTTIRCLNGNNNTWRRQTITTTTRVGVGGKYMFSVDLGEIGVERMHHEHFFIAFRMSSFTHAND